ncbi:MAG: AMIN domain-containing protein, partial [Acidobacteriia bacterium]|nr:AMIN domain-containing protein [Terriglobia bacterium]
MKLMAAIAVSVPLLAGPVFAQPYSVTAVRHWTVGGVTRIAIQVTGEFEVRSDRLHNPERVYFDIHDARPLFENRRRFYSEEVDDPLLKRMRVAETTPGVTRLVLELADGVEATPSQLSNPHRLMIELRHSTAPSADTPPQLATTPVPAVPLSAAAPITPSSAPKVPLASVT